MKKYLLLFFSVIVIPCNSLLSQISPGLRYTENNLFDIEMEFSKISTTKGFKVANFIYAADSAIVFRPFEVNALKWASEQPDSIFGIRWYPSFVEMSAAGDLGYAVGPFENHYSKSDTSKYIPGQFATIWQKQSDGSLKFIMDFGTNRLPDSFQLIKEPVFRKTSGLDNRHIEKPINEKKELKKFEEAEEKFSRICEESGDLKAYTEHAAKEIRLFYQREFYVLGLDSVMAILASQKGYHKWKIKKINLSASGDLAHVYGTHEYIENGISKDGYFMRIWKKDNGKKWKLALQVRSLLD